MLSMVQMKSSLGLGQKMMNTIASKCLIFFYDLIMKIKWMDGCDWWMKTSTCEDYHIQWNQNIIWLVFFGCVTSLVSCFFLHS